MTTHYLVTDTTASNWEWPIYAFLAEKERRSGSMRTSQAYSRMLFHFLGALGKTPEEVSPQDVFAYAHSMGPSGRNFFWCLVPIS